MSSSGGDRWVATELTPATGVASERPMVLIHGVGTNRSIWERSLPTLAERRDVIRVDLPGFGDSPAPAEWTLEGTADLIAETLETDFGPDLDLIGSSLGGAVGLTMAARKPELIARMVLAAPAGFRPVPGPLPHIAAAIAGPMLAGRRSLGMRLADHGQARRAFLAGTVADGSALDPETARLVWRASEGAASLGPAFRAAASADLRERAAAIEKPFGVIWGSLDRVIPAHAAERILEIHPDLPIEVISGAGHIPHLEMPAEFCAAVERVHSQLP